MKLATMFTAAVLAVLALGAGKVAAQTDIVAVWKTRSDSLAALGRDAAERGLYVSAIRYTQLARAALDSASAYLASGRGAPAAATPLAPASRTKGRYTVRELDWGELWLIGDVVFEAKSYCLSIQDGEEVVFTEGGPDRYTLSAEFVGLSSKQVCRVWRKD